MRRSPLMHDRPPEHGDSDGAAAGGAARRRRWVVGAATAVLALGAAGATFALRERTPAASAQEGAEGTRPLVVPAGAQQLTLDVQGMYCASCESTVASLLRRTPGVVGAAVSVARAEAVVVYDPRRTSPAQLIGVIERLGYTAAPRQS